MMKHISQKFKIFKKYLLNTDIYLIAMTRGNLQPKKKKKKIKFSKFSTENAEYVSRFPLGQLIALSCI